MIIVSYQNIDILNIIEKDGYACCKSPEFALDDAQIMFAYKWMAGKMRELVGPPRHEGVEFPMWGWAQQVCSKKEIRPSGNDFSTRVDRIAMLTLDVPENQMLLSDFNDWHAPLNQIPVYTSDKEGRKLRKDIEALNFPFYTNLAEYPQELRDRIVSTWNLMFELKSRGKGSMMRRNRTIQATFWEIRKEWVRNIRILESKAFRSKD